MNQNSIRAVWEAELDRLELDVLRVERILKGLSALPTEPWTPPAIPGQMPADLLGRAQALLDRQEQVTAELGTALVSAQKQIAFGDRVVDATGQGRIGPVYLDLEA